MNKTHSARAIATVSILLALGFSAPRADAVEALHLQDTYVDNGTSGGKSPPNASNYGSGMDLRVFKGNGRVARTFLKFSLETFPPGASASAGSSGLPGIPGPAGLPGLTGPPG